LNKTIFFKGAIALLLVLFGSQYCCFAEKRVEVLIAGEVFHLEVAETSDAFTQGLMRRKHLKSHHGMLFPFKTPQKTYFWMKNCLLPLDILFIKQGKVVNIAEHAQPCLQDPCQVFASSGMVDTVIELNAGISHTLHLKPGSHINTPE